MFTTYLRRELGNRTRQTVIVAVGMALAIALVIVVASISAGVRDAQARVLESIYGIGTDVTVTAPAAAPGEDGGPRFEFGSGAGETDAESGTTTISQTQLSTDFGTATIEASALEDVLATDGVAAATATLSLQNRTFSGEMPDPSQFGQGGPGEAGGTPPESGGADGAGGSAFDIDQFSVEGVDPAVSDVGPLTAVTVTEGRSLAAADAGTNVVVLDAAYATTAELAVGDTLAIGGEDFEIVGLVASDSADATTAADAYIPLDVAQALSGEDGLVSTIYVQADDASQVATLATSLESAVPDAEVNTQEDLASTVSGSLSTASTLLGTLGTWLSVIVLAAAFVLAILFTLSGVGRRTREFGTLKAIGWSNGRIVRQVAGESLVQGLLGGALGVAVGLAAILAVNLAAPSLTASTGGGLFPGAPTGDVATTDGGSAVPAGPGGLADTSSSTDVTLSAPVALEVLLLAVGLAVLGGLLAGAIGGWRAARLRPAEALRSVA